MTTGVVVPYRAGPGRHGLDRVTAQLHAALACPLVVADDGGAPFSRGQSIMAGIARLPTDTQVVLVCDADLLVPAEQLRQAVADAASRPGLVVAFDRYHYLTAEQSWALTADPQLPVPDAPATEWTLTTSVGGCHAYSTASLAATGGYPPIFRGWGMEDVAYQRISEMLAGPTRRIAGPAWHLWHPVDRTNNPQDVGYQHNVAALHSIWAADHATHLRTVLAELAEEAHRGVRHSR